MKTKKEKRERGRDNEKMKEKKDPVVPTRLQKTFVLVIIIIKIRIYFRNNRILCMKRRDKSQAASLG